MQVLLIIITDLKSIYINNIYDNIINTFNHIVKVNRSFIFYIFINNFIVNY